MRHWISLCWFFLSIFSCLNKRKKNYYTVLKHFPFGDFFHVCSYCFLSRSFSSTSSKSPRPSWPKLLTQLGNKKKCIDKFVYWKHEVSKMKFWFSNIIILSLYCSPFFFLLQLLQASSVRMTQDLYLNVTIFFTF